MSGLSNSWKDASDLEEEDKKLLERLVTTVCSQVFPTKNPVQEYWKDPYPRTLIIGDCLRQLQEYTIAQLVIKLFKERRRALNTFKRSKDNSDRCNVTEINDDVEVKIEAENKTEGDSVTVDKIGDGASPTETSDDKEKEVNTLKNLEEVESMELGNNLNSVDETVSKSQSDNINEKKIDEVVGNVSHNIVLKIETSSESEKEMIGLTPEEEEEIKKLILLAERNCREQDTTPVETVVDDDKIPGGDENKNTEDCEQDLKLEPDIGDDSESCNQGVEDTLEGLEFKRSKYELPERSTPPISDPRSRFYIDPRRITATYYRDLIVSNGWTPAQVTHKLCVQCNWSKPEYRMIEFCPKKGYWYSVKINNLNFVSHERARSKSKAMSLAAVRFMNYIGLKFHYQPLTKQEWRSRFYSPWGERYSNYNSLRIAKEEEKLGIKYAKGYSERSDSDNDRYYKRKRSSSNESRKSKTIRMDSPHRRRDIMRKNRSSHEPRRDVSPRSPHRRPYLRMDQEAERRAKLVHKRISVTHVYDCKRSPSRSSHSGHHSSSRSRSGRDSPKYRRHHTS